MTQQLERGGPPYAKAQRAMAMLKSPVYDELLDASPRGLRNVLQLGPRPHERVNHVRFDHPKRPRVCLPVSSTPADPQSKSAVGVPVSEARAPHGEPKTLAIVLRHKTFLG